MTYNDVVLAMESWAKKNSIVIVGEDIGSQRKFFYVSSGKGETLQFVLEKVENSQANLNVYSVEASNDEDIHWKFVFQADDILIILNMLLKMAGLWFER